MENSKLKINNSKSSATSKIDRLKLLEEKANEFVDKQKKFNIQAAELSKMFVEILENSIVEPTIKEKEFQDGVVSKFLNISNEMNADSSFPESFGSLGLNALCLRSILLLKSQINRLNYELQSFKNGLQRTNITNDDIRK